MNKLSIIIPCYNEEDVLPIFYKEITAVAKEIEEVDFEFIFIDDGSTDKTLRVILELNQKDDRVKYISFSRNFGKEAAIYAGLKKSEGDYVALMDADLQDPPFLLKEMYELVTQEGYDSVATRRKNRNGESKIRSFFARRFYWLMNRISDTNIVDGARDFRLMTRQMVNSILDLSEYNRFSKGIFGWVGFTTKWLDYENIQRAAGNTKWSFWGLFLYSLDGIFAFSSKPLAISSILGVLFCCISFVMICFIVIRTLIWGDPVAGFPALICAIFFLGGIQLFCLGVLGQYLSKTYLETKKRPVYIVKKEN
jgi:glycosyltransferase involved in cell wall biosynthesis